MLPATDERDRDERQTNSVHNVYNWYGAGRFKRTRPDKETSKRTTERDDSNVANKVVSVERPCYLLQIGERRSKQAVVSVNC